MTATPEAPAGARRLVARRRAPAAAPLWWEPWMWTIEGDDGFRLWLSYRGCDAVPEPSQGMDRALHRAGFALDPDGVRTVTRGQAVRYDGPELCEEHAWPLVRVAPPVWDAAPADVVGGRRRGP
jgi:hypothetical protein